MARMDKVKEIHPGRVVTEPGAIIAALDRETRAHSGQELRFPPLDGQHRDPIRRLRGRWIGAGWARSTGAGCATSATYCGLRVVTMEAEPRIIDLTGYELQKVKPRLWPRTASSPRGGVEMPLTAAYDWVDVLVGYDDYMDAVRFADDLAHAGGILTKEIAPIAVHPFLSSSSPATGRSSAMPDSRWSW